MSSRNQAILGTIMTLVLLAHAWLYVNFLAMASSTPDPATGRVLLWPLARHRPHYMTHDQYWVLVATGAVFVACFLGLIFTERSYRELGED